MNYSVDTLISDLKEEFEGINFSFEEINYRGKLPCFFIKIGETDKLDKIWMKASDIIAVNFQSRLVNEFSIWNIYLFFIVNEPIENDLKYLIENDTFSSRKIVIVGDIDFREIIDEHILNSDIKIDASKVNENIFSPNPIFYDQIYDMDAKTRVTNAMKDVFSNIISEIKADNHEV